MIPFNKPSIRENERSHMAQAIANLKLCGDGAYTKKVYEIFRETLGVEQMLLTTSCSHALDMTAILAGFQEGDEVIAPSYTFVSTINAFALRGVTLDVTIFKGDVPIPHHFGLHIGAAAPGNGVPAGKTMLRRQTIAQMPLAAQSTSITRL